jgi:triacylglycerol esterase/lipase EstA (alpha/beta hydrolase family)
MGRRWVSPALLLAMLASFAPLAGTAVAATKYAPLNRPGPKLTVPRSDLRASLVCSRDVRNAKREPVLLLPATGVDSGHNFSWNYERAFDQLGIPFCASDQQGALSSNMDDIQTRGDYVTYAIRKMHRLAGRRIATLGHSQGGMITRWSLRFWPDTRRMVDDVIGMAGSNHGSSGGGASCAAGCSAAFAQQSADSNFIAALNSRRETFQRISYTEIYTNNDEVVTPPPSAGVSGPGKITNVAIQSICPADPEEHLSIGTSDATAYGLVVDALNRRGPAKPSRVDPAVCDQALMPGIDTNTYAADTAASFAFLGNSIATYPHVTAEPPLRCYVKLRCKG